MANDDEQPSEKSVDEQIADMDIEVGEWVPVDANTHVMPLEVFADEAGALVRCIMQVESEKSGSVALVETSVPLDLLVHWMEDDDEAPEE